ncbi:hypothetical protein [Mesorhizobium sp. M7A.F.Ca.ET.027.02.1.1]|uniref:hypothetical protein n=1 Tax=Mesorhizobium sp. M7A.F.Ca.ET.027.02.1.1 TaxID=2496655 RepID=UPI0016753F41|nr:hypothetical protein [Mesorhizobium sp. M7A.F.Ca.ET.027.02.1.1]
MSDEYDPYSPRGPARERPGAKMAADADEASGPQTVAAGQLRAFIERIDLYKAALGMV